jgi:hypothetical protein
MAPKEHILDALRKGLKVERFAMITVEQLDFVAVYIDHKEYMDDGYLAALRELEDAGIVELDDTESYPNITEIVTLAEAGRGDG